MKDDVIRDYPMSDNNLESIAWFIVECKMESVLEKIINELIAGLPDE